MHLLAVDRAMDRAVELTERADVVCAHRLGEEWSARAEKVGARVVWPRRSRELRYHRAVRTYRVSAKDRLPLIEFMVRALHECGCRVLYVPDPAEAPFRITFETPGGERHGIIAYAFLANHSEIKNRPKDEHRFQIKYGSDFKSLHEIWQDPYYLYTTLFVGIDPELGFFVGADPVLHNPTRFSVSVEFKQHDVDEVLRKGWHAWERVSRTGKHPIEVLVGGRPESFLRYVRLEREALGEAPGHRQLLAERFLGASLGKVPGRRSGALPSGRELHQLAKEFALSEEEVLNLIESRPRLKMAVRGWVAEVHLHRLLAKVRGVTDCIHLTSDGGADIALRYRGSRLTVECKNALRRTNKDGLIRVDFQRTRASKGDPCSRYYSPDDFNIVAACTHARTEKWDFRFVPSVQLDPHRRCDGKLDNNVKLDDRWSDDPRVALRAAAG